MPDIQWNYLITSLQSISIGQNTAYAYAVSLCVFVGLLIALKLFQVVLVGRLKRLAERSKTDFDDAIIGIFKNIKPPFYLMIALYVGLQFLALPEIAGRAAYVFFVVAVTYEVIQAVEQLVGYGLHAYAVKNKEENENDEHATSMVRTMHIMVRAVVWVVGILLILSNLNVNVSSLVASLGIGGIAIALALQNVLSDVFSSFSIYVDKPFKVGDFIVVGADSGTVERIGLKTTRVRTLQGEELVISNKELTTARVQNFKRMERRRVLFTIGVVYGTASVALESIPVIVQEIVDSIDGLEFDRCHFATYGDFSLNFEIVFYVQSSNYVEYMDRREAVNLALYQRFEKEKIEFAYPTQTVFVNKG